MVLYIKVLEDTKTPEPTTKSTPNPTPAVTVASSATPTPIACDKMVKYDNKTGIIPNRYILMLKKDTTEYEMKELVKQLKSLIIPDTHKSIKVKEVIIPVESMKMIIVEINQAGLQWVSININRVPLP